MAFDTAAARAAGYSDAEIASHLAQRWNFDLTSAKSSGYTDGDVIAHLSAKDAAYVPIPGQEGELSRAKEARAQPGPSIADRVVGAGEAALTVATGATGGTLGMIGGTLKGLAEQILSGKFGTQEAARLVEQSAAGGAAALTYQPRTEAGREAVQAIGEVGQELLPVAGLLPQAQAITAAAKSGAAAPAPVVARAAVEGAGRAVAGPAGAAGVARAIDTGARVADLARKNITTLPRRALEAVRTEQAPTAGTLGSVGAAGADMATQRRALAADLPVPIRLTRGQATRDPAQMKFEVETAKLPEHGAALRRRFVQQNEQILRNFDQWIDQTGAEAPNLRAVGMTVDRALVNQAKSDKAAIRAAYRAAQEAGELEQPVALDSVVRHLNESAPDAATAPLLDVARRRAIQLGLASEGPDGQLIPAPVSLRTAETYRQAIGRATDYEATNVRQATIIKSLLDESTEGLGGDLYKRARAMRRRYAQNYEDRAAISRLLETKRGTTDRRVAFEDVFDQTILRGSLDDVRNVRRVLQRGGEEGSQAWREIQGQTARWIKDQAERNVATDSAGNRVLSPAALDKAIRELDADGRLDFIFGKQGGQKMRDIRDLSLIARTVPPEAAVNTSNTASTLLSGFIDVGTSGATGVPLPIATMIRVIRQNVKDRNLRIRIEDALSDIEKRAPTQKKPARKAPGPETLH
jgi:hypothetical protein